jgi:uncharacterized protein (TIGR03118 family)
LKSRRGRETTLELSYSFVVNRHAVPRTSEVKRMKTFPFRTRYYSPTDVVTLAIACLICAVWLTSPCAAQNDYIQHNLVSDINGLANHTDPNLVNPWGIASSATSPFWVSDNHRGVSTLYNSTGNPIALVVTIPPAPGSPPGTIGSPTGVVFNSTADFQIGASPARFIFATEDGTIAGWNGGTSAVTEAATAGGVYKGIAIGNNGISNFLYAANFHSGAIDVFNNLFAPTTLAGSFTDPNLPAGYAPFNIQNVNGSLLVTYALQDAFKHDDVPGAGHGFVDRFDLNGNLQQRLITDGVLNSPWGLAIAPGAFGAFSNDLLVGNFGDGRINAFDLANGTFLGTLQDGNGNPITIEGLWGLRVGNGGNGGDPNTVYFAAGIPGGGEVEDHGLFGSITVPESGATLSLMVLGLVALAGCGRALRPVRLQVFGP